MAINAVQTRIFKDKLKKMRRETEEHMVERIKERLRQFAERELKRILRL